MAINTGSVAVPLDDTTMIVIRNSKKPIDPARKRELAARCDINCIRLRWKDDLSTTVGTSGFQPVYLMTEPKAGGGTGSVARWLRNEFTQEPMAERSMDFVPDEMGTGWAYLPDSPFNRVRLAYAEIKGNALWDIHDKAILSEIRELANEIQKSVEFRMEQEAEERAATEVSVRVQERGAITGLGQKTRVEIENQVLMAKIKEAEQEILREKLKKQLADLQASRGIPVTVDVPTASVPPAPATPVIDADVAEKERQQEIRKQAVAEIHSENAELLDQIKKENLEKTGKNQGWPFSQAYRDKIKPLVDARVRELNEHSTVGGAT